MKFGPRAPPGPSTVPPFKSLLEAVALLEPLHPASRVHNALLTGEERVAPATHLDPHLGFGRSRLPGVATGAGKDRVHVLRVYLRLQLVLLARRQYADLLAAALPEKLELHPAGDGREAGEIKPEP